MILKIYKSLWGMTGSVEEQLSKIAEAGYDGVESGLSEISDHGEFKQLLIKYQLGYLPLIYTEGDNHIEKLGELVGIASQYEPKKIIAHAGRDLWSFDEQINFFENALSLEEEFEIPIAHETHRRRPLFSPMNSLAILRQLPKLKINADLSHWCCVTESMLEDHTEAIKLVGKQAIHIHCRVGYENGPQVPNPAAPEWGEHLAKFEEWWKIIIIAYKQRGETEITITPEYGPPSYMQTTPFENKPVADLWNVCLWSSERFRKLFEESI